MGCQMDTMEPNSDHKMEKVKLANIHFKDCPKLRFLTQILQTLHTECYLRKKCKTKVNLT